jgi:DNA invertase Pin-like site-specific DNA recombinase
MPEPKRAAIYVRISRDSELDGLGVKRQEKECRALAKKRGWTVDDVFVDNDVSASKKKARPAYEQMMKAVESRRVQAVIVWDVDRLTRKPRELEDWIDHADELGLQLASVGGEIDLATEQGRAMARMKGVFARLEAETIAKRQRAKHKEMAETGRYIGPRPFGYRFATDAEGNVLTGRDQRLVVDPDEAAVVRECVQRALKGEGLWKIANDLNDRGITTSTGGRWQTQPLRRLLLRPLYAGLRKHQEYKDGQWVGKEQIHEGLWDAIIERDTHDRLVAKLTDPKRVSNKGDTELKYLLTWIVECGACGRPLVGAKGYEYRIKGSYIRKDGTRSPDKVRKYPALYKCPHQGCHRVNRRMDHVDDYVERHVVALLSVAGVQIFGGDQQAVDEAREQIGTLKAKLELLSDRWMDGGPGAPTDDQFSRQNARLKAQLDGAEARLTAAMPAEGMEEFTGADAAMAWMAADVAQKRIVLKALIERAKLQVTIDSVGAGHFSKADADPYAGIRLEWANGEE